MKAIFEKLFQVEYSFIVKMAFLLHIFLSSHSLFVDIIGRFPESYIQALKTIMCNRDDFVDKQIKITPKPEYCRTGISYLYQFPFIKYNDKIFFPTPHLHMRSITSSLLYRLTEDNDVLRSQFGKYVLEEYVYRLFLDSELYDEVIAEITYGKTSSKSSDVITRNGKSILLIETKSYVPKSGIRNLDICENIKDKHKLCEYVKQVYRQIKVICNGDFIPFPLSRSNDVNEIFGLLVLLEDSYIDRKSLFESVSVELGIALDSLEYQYICSHIKILGLYEVEQITFGGCNIIELFKLNRNVPNRWFDYKFKYKPRNKKLPHNVQAFCDNLKDAIIYDLSQIGFFSNQGQQSLPLNNTMEQFCELLNEVIFQP